MGWLRNCFRTAGEVSSLTREAGFLQGLLEARDKRIELLESAIVSERKAKDKVLLRHADQMSLLAKAGQHFVNDAIPKLEIEPEPLTLQEIERLEWAAKASRDADLELGIDKPIELYLEGAKKDPYRYLSPDGLN